MTDQDIQKYGEIQYLIGRIDELTLKALPNVLDLHGHRKLDARIEKYYDKLKSVDEVAYHMYLVESHSRRISKLKSKEKIKSLFELASNHIKDENVLRQIKDQITKL
jgi:hypothetical protein